MELPVLDALPSSPFFQFSLAASTRVFGRRLVRSLEQRCEQRTMRGLGGVDAHLVLEKGMTTLISASMVGVRISTLLAILAVSLKISLRCTFATS
jgi:hypothetical protein